MLARIEMSNTSVLRVVRHTGGDRYSFEVKPTVLAVRATDPSVCGYRWREPFLFTPWRNVK